MGLHPQDLSVIPEETARAARATSPKGNAYVTLRDERGVIYEDRALPRCLAVAVGDRLNRRAVWRW